MRTAPAVRVVVRQFGAWQVMVCVAVGLGAAAGAAWLSSLGDTVPVWLRLVLAVALIANLAAAASTGRVPAARLVWDGQVWQLGDASVPGNEVGRTGRLLAVIDLGAWMLIRFDAEAAPGARARRIWLPVQRRGLEAQWHVLRCAVHAPLASAGRSLP